jgi:hypothetical protein
LIAGIDCLIEAGNDRDEYGNEKIDMVMYRRAELIP